MEPYLGDLYHLSYYAIAVLKIKNHKGTLYEESKQLFARYIPLNRMGQPEEGAIAVAYFAGEKSAYPRGQILSVSGQCNQKPPFSHRKRWLL